MMKQRIAITGGRGRLASSAAAYLRQQGYEVILFSRMQGEGFQPIDDLFDPKVLSSLTTLIHAAWSTVPFSSEIDPGREEREDIPFMKNILKTFHHLASAASVPKFIFISSASVYGNQKEEPATELTLCKPLSNYARAKLLAEELLLQAAADDRRLKPLLLRVTNVIGLPSNNTIPQGIVPKIIEAAKDHKTLEIWGTGQCYKDYLWIDDFLEALKTALEMPVEGIFNIGSGKNFSILELVKIVEEITNHPISIQYHSRYPWDVSCAKISSAAFMKATDWRPQADIIKKIKMLFQSY